MGRYGAWSEECLAAQLLLAPLATQIHPESPPFEAIRSLSSLKSPRVQTRLRRLLDPALRGRLLRGPALRGGRGLDRARRPRGPALPHDLQWPTARAPALQRQAAAGGLRHAEHPEEYDTGLQRLQVADAAELRVPGLKTFKTLKELYDIYEDHHAADHQTQLSGTGPAYRRRFKSRAYKALRRHLRPHRLISYRNKELSRGDPRRVGGTAGVHRLSLSVKCLEFTNAHGVSATK